MPPWLLYSFNTVLKNHFLPVSLTHSHCGIACHCRRTWQFILLFPDIWGVPGFVLRCSHIDSVIAHCSFSLWRKTALAQALRIPTAEDPRNKSSQSDTAKPKEASRQRPTYHVQKIRTLNISRNVRPLSKTQISFTEKQNRDYLLPTDLLYKEVPKDAPRTKDSGENLRSRVQMPRPEATWKQIYSVFFTQTGLRTALWLKSAKRFLFLSPHILLLRSKGMSLF